MFSEEQRAIIEAPIDELTVVMSTAAAGKTACVTERLRYVLNQGVDPHKVVAITFTNNAAAEMRTRLGNDFRQGMFMGTIHSYANMLLTSKGYDTSDIRDDEDFDELFEMITMYPDVLREVDYLLCDEAQDLNAVQFDFIVNIICPKAMLITGDVRQSIYGFKGAVPDLLMALTRNPDYVTRNLTQNYRNAKKILSFSNSIIDKMKKAPKERPVAMRDEEGKVSRIGEWEIVSTIKQDPHWGNWAILCRTNKKIETIMRVLKKNNIPAITFRQAQGNLEDLQEKMDSNTVKVLTIHSAKGLEFPNVIVCDLYTKGQENMRLNYVSVTRARDKLYLCV